MNPAATFGVHSPAFSPRTYPVDEASYRQSRPCEVAVGRHLLHRVLQNLLFRSPRDFQVRQTLLLRRVGELAENEAFHADGLGGVDHRHLVHDPLHADGADDGILAAEGLLEGRDGVVGSDDVDTAGECGLRRGAGEDRDGEIGGG